MIPGIDNTLPEGTYELRETQPPTSYNRLTHYIRFTISSTGGVTLANTYADVTLDSELTAGHMTYIMSVTNTNNGGYLTVSKTVQGNMGDKTKLFGFEIKLNDSNGNILNSIDVTYSDGRTDTIDLDSEGKGTFYLSHGQSIIISLPINTDYVITELDDVYNTTYRYNSGTEHSGKTAAGVFDESITINYTNTLGAVIPTGINTSVNILISAFAALLAGIVINFIGNYRRRLADDEQA